MISKLRIMGILIVPWEIQINRIVERDQDRRARQAELSIYFDEQGELNSRFISQFRARFDHVIVRRNDITRAKGADHVTI